ncbi:hypothetical protein PF010_g5763 [Phytophthora fragariae]|uniref:Uncharacterized protein n=2 Tax=Phytophthora fragariae TaxID=53985 RepID=A0A6A3UHW0_9STRA|nr:hypothetical protein PF007_g6665 [Phytophthora fragariae]KAE9125087.1 hypothetical protein PF010_g5763 [Phytophthora fragariae]KAE9149696.1 hypothetical protein PF006_g5836 [Phytophthora fragariae]KAE9244865.1 hypothetical protein PF002_g7538 [Phytophthora fragariae]KAE9244958.1 hypothetical protein PF004_g5453 [Phytophthora fragariae]
MEEDIDMDDGEQPFTGAPQSAMPLTVDGVLTRTPFLQLRQGRVKSHRARVLVATVLLMKFVATILTWTAQQVWSQSTPVPRQACTQVFSVDGFFFGAVFGLVALFFFDELELACSLAFFAGGVCGSDEDDSCELGALSRRLACMETGSSSHKLGSISCPRMVTRFWLEAAAGSPPLLVTELVLGGVDVSVLYS